MVKTFSRLTSGLRSLAGYFGASWSQSTIGSWFSGYPSTDVSRKEIFNNWRPRGSTSNQLLGPSLGTLTAQCRHIERSTPLGRAVCEGLVADVIGSGIGLRPDSGDSRLDLDLSEEFERWADCAMVDGRSIWQWQAVCMREMATSGAGLVRWVWLKERAEKGLVPWALLPLEVEWFATEPVRQVSASNRFLRGIEFDSLARPVFQSMTWA